MKPEPNHEEYIRILRSMTPEQRLDIALELSELTRDMLRHALRKQYPHLSEEQLHKLYLERLDRCHNENY